MPSSRATRIPAAGNASASSPSPYSPSRNSGSARIARRWTRRRATVACGSADGHQHRVEHRVGRVGREAHWRCLSGACRDRQPGDGFRENRREGYRSHTPHAAADDPVHLLQAQLRTHTATSDSAMTVRGSNSNRACGASLLAGTCCIRRWWTRATSPGVICGKRRRYGRPVPGSSLTGEVVPNGPPRLLALSTRNRFVSTYLPSPAAARL